LMEQYLIGINHSTRQGIYIAYSIYEQSLQNMWVICKIKMRA